MLELEKYIKGDSKTLNKFVSISIIKLNTTRRDFVSRTPLRHPISILNK